MREWSEGQLFRSCVLCLVSGPSVILMDKRYKYKRVIAHAAYEWESGVKYDKVNFAGLEKAKIAVTASIPLRIRQKRVRSGKLQANVVLH